MYTQAHESQCNVDSIRAIKAKNELLSCYVTSTTDDMQNCNQTKMD